MGTGKRGQGHERSQRPLTPRRRRRFIAVAMVVTVGSLLGSVATGPSTSAFGDRTDAAQSPSAPRHDVKRHPKPDGELLYGTEGNRLRRYDVDTIGTGALAEDVLVPSADDDPKRGRDVNGEICPMPDGRGFVASEDTGQPATRPGWGVFDDRGRQIGKLAATYSVAGAEPFGCEFAPDGTLFTSQVGFQGFGTANGELMMWFPPYEQFPGPPGAYPDTGATSTSYCKLATDLGTAGAVAVDPQGRIYVAQSSGLKIERFSPPFPTGPDAAGGCGRTDATGAPLADEVHREVFATASQGMLSFSGLAFAPSGNLYAASVFTGRIAEYDPDGRLVRFILEPPELFPPHRYGNPQGIAVGADGSVYYADLDLVGTLPDVGPGPNGSVRRITFDADGNPRPPDIVREGLAFPDGVALFPGNLQKKKDPKPLEWPTLAGGPTRSFFNPKERHLTPDTAPTLVERWRFETGAIVTASPTVGTVDLPGRRRTRVVYVASWDGHVYALDWRTGAEIWRFTFVDQPGASYPAAGSVTLTRVGTRWLAVFGAGERVYAVDAATGQEVWQFVAGTGCGELGGAPFPGLCGFGGERNQVESTPIVTGGTVYVGMDVNDVATGKGGFFALDVDDGRLVWFFDPQSGAVCRPDPGDAVRRYDGYHSATELGLPTDFFTTRSGCDHPRDRTGCGNVWSSPALDTERRLLYFGTSNCDTDDDPATSQPAPPMPPYDEALVALRLDGTPAWRWRPREVDPDDLAFGAAPNLFRIRTARGQARDVVGIGSKDGTYYVLDREGRNVRTGVRWSDPGAATSLPYWQTKVVPGGAIGGVIQTAAIDQRARKVLFSTGPGEDVLAPQRPTVHALDLDTGAVLWQNRATDVLGGDASYGPTSAVPGVAIVGSVITPHLRLFDTRTGRLLLDRNIGSPPTFSGISSGATVLDGTLVVGTGIGSRTQTGSSPGDFAAYTPAAVVALCVPGSRGCR